jgi:OOP family OmpA-OmpF porin
MTYGVLLSAAIAFTGCGGTIAFQGQQALNVVGEPPAPPPPPPPPPKKEEPPAPPPRVEVKDNKIEIREKIQFEVAKATILPASDSLLAEIADVFKKNKHIKKVAIEGHASAEGDAKKNMTLSDERAKAVMKHLIDKGGVEKTRLSAKGFGVTKPIADNGTEDGREKNRRVEFNIVEQDVTQKKVEIDPKTGKEKVIEEKKSTEKKEEPAPAAKDAKAPAPAAPAKPADAKPAEAKKPPALKAPEKPADPKPAPAPAPADAKK